MTMAESSQSDEIVKRLNDNLECTICMGQYTDPRILDCVHSFCLKCIKAHVGDSPVIRCPLCNDESTKPSSGAEGLKSNFFIRALLEDVMCKNMDDADSDDKSESKAKICGSCDEGSIATSHCSDCDCELCEDCVKLHAKLKGLKMHQVTAYPTEEEIQAQMEVEVTTRVSQLKYDIGVTLSDIQQHIERVNGQMGEINTQRKATLAQVQLGQQNILNIVNTYVIELNEKINENADQRLGDLPDQLKNYEKNLAMYNTLQKQAESIHDMELKRKLKLSKQLQREMDEWKDQMMGKFVGSIRNESMPHVKFETGNLAIGVEAVIKCGIGFLTPTKSRKQRVVEVKDSSMYEKMQRYAIKCTHDALDQYGMDPDNMSAIADHIHTAFTNRYNRGTWNCFVCKGVYGHGHGCCKQELLFKVDNFQIILTEHDE